VPVIAAIAAVALLGETISARLVGCGAVVLGGVGLALSGRARPGSRPVTPTASTAGKVGQPIVTER